MAEYPTYTAYKSSNIEWLGDIPEHWEVWKITHGFNIIGSGTTPKSDNPLFYDGCIPWVTTSELREKVITNTAQKVTKEAVALHSALKIYPQGSLAIAMYGATIGRLGILGVDATFNQACCVFSEPTVFDQRFVYYWLWMRRPILISLSNGGGQPNLSQDDLKKLWIPIPGIREQQTIARFLDFKTAQIDTLISKQKALLDKLAEKRTALISHAVTKGLDPSVKMKDSGVEWLGEIPHTWNVTRLRFLVKMSGGMTPSTNKPEYWGGDIPWVSPKDMKRDAINDSIDTLTEQALLDTNISLYEPNNVLIVVRGMILAHTFPVAINTVPVTVNQDMKVLSTSLDCEYLSLLLKGIQGLILSVVEESAHGTKVLRTDVFKNIYLPVPPKDEQKNIVKEIKKITHLIDKQINSISLLIARLQEYRSTLITSAVTGKIDVRDFSIPKQGESQQTECA
ncbi:restriction endonuclease subunit S [Pectobacterium versatile]|uniref:restriction endonuclease subunit S n=1 Tax=Pectobacterium versatile TaxID=2488639 RepID=UPI002B25241C|nr:restriction endonuclease subunit S [Pectobacterium versatile]